MRLQVLRAERDDSSNKFRESLQRGVKERWRRCCRVVNSELLLTAPPGREVATPRVTALRGARLHCLRQFRVPPWENGREL